nr:proprotein convertase subtilisin/kexin type 5-like isoform X2 [Callithrix jacchus]
MAVEGVCKHCPEMCQDCIHEKTCKECMPEFFLHNDVCHQSCPRGSYADSRHCVPCHKDCLECSGPNADDCIIEFLGPLRWAGLCLEECLAGTYYEKETKECRGCHKSCLTCSSSGTCTTCQKGLMKNPRGSCMANEKCTPYEYWDEDATRCKPCHAKCFRCTGPAEDQCCTCPRDSLLLNTTCVKDCPEGYYADEDSHRCARCHSSCRTCDGRHSRQCHSCHLGWFQLGKECLLQCREGYYAENSTGQCEKWNRSCKTCQGPQPTDCLSCDTFFFLLSSKGECHRTCPDHYYAEQRTQTCERYHPTCDQCKVESLSDILHVV